MSTTTIKRTVKTVEISCDTDEGTEFAAWLRSVGVDASVGDSTGSYVDGVWTSTCDAASEALLSLWEEYCSCEEETVPTEPTVASWHTPPECRGQIVVRSYGTDDESDPWCRVIDRSDGAVRYEALDREELDATDWASWCPWDVEPSARSVGRTER